MAGPKPFSFYVHVDKKPLTDDQELTFADDHTYVTEEEAEDLKIGGHHARLLKLTVRSDRYSERKVAVLRIQATNDEFTELALEEGWKTHCLITVCDGCLPWGENNVCENDITGRRKTNLLQLAPNWLITDHFMPDRQGNDWDPAPGEVVKSEDPKRFPLKFVHACALAGPKYSADGTHNRYPGRFARLYEVVTRSG